VTPSGSSTAHIYTQTIHRTENGTYITTKKLNIHNNKKLTNFGSAGRALSLQFIPWHLLYNRGKKHVKTSVMVAARTSQADTVQYKNNEQYNTQKKNSNTE
jgi:hypothetical protein